MIVFEIMVPSSDYKGSKFLTCCIIIILAILLAQLAA